MSVTNSIGKDLTRAVLWQYDNATNFNALVDILSELYKKSTEEFWNNFEDFLRLDDPNKISEFGLSIWYKILGLPNVDTITVKETEPYRSYTADKNTKIKLAYHTLLYRMKGCSLENLIEYISNLSDQLRLKRESILNIDYIAVEILSDRTDQDVYLQIMINRIINTSSIDSGYAHVLPATQMFGMSPTVTHFTFEKVDGQGSVIYPRGVTYRFDNGVLDYNYLPPR